MIWFEIAAVLCIGVFPFLRTVLSPLWSRGSEILVESRDIPNVISNIVYYLFVIVPIAWIMVRSGESAQRYGIRQWQWRIDSGIALVTAITYCASLWVGMLIFTGLQTVFPNSVNFVSNVLTIPGIMLQALPIVDDQRAWPLGILSVILFTVIDELVYRSYLINRFRDVGIPAFAAVLISGLLFASCRLNQGFYYAFCIFFMGMAMGGLFLLTRRILPIVIGRALVNSLITLYYIFSSANHPR